MGLIKTLGAGIKNTVGGITGAVGGVVGGVGSAVGGVGNAIGSTAQTLGQSIGTAAQTALEEASTLEYFMCPEFKQGELCAPAVFYEKGQVVPARTIITDGSYFNIAQGQALIILADGQIAECVICHPGSETDANGNVITGQYRFRTNLAPSFFTTTDAGGMKWNGGAVWKSFTDRIMTGGYAHHTFNAFYINLKPLLGGIPVGGSFSFRARDFHSVVAKIGFHGNVTPRIVDPMTFYSNCVNAGGVSSGITLESLGGTDFIRKMCSDSIKAALNSASNANMKDNMGNVMVNQMTGQPIPRFQHYSDLEGEELRDYIMEEVLLSKTSGSLGGMGISLDKMSTINVAPTDTAKFDEMYERLDTGSSQAMMNAKLLENQGIAAGNSGGAANGAIGMMGFGMMNGMMGGAGMMPGMGMAAGMMPQQGAYPQQGMPQGVQQGYPQQGMQQGYPQQGYPQQGMQRQGYPQQGIPQQGYQQQGMQQQGYPQQGMQQQGMQQQGYQQQGAPQPQQGYQQQAAPQPQQAAPQPQQAVPQQAAPQQTAPQQTAPQPQQAAPQPDLNKASGGACSKCGWNPPNPNMPPKYCPSCGNILV